ncbi:MAG: SIS domain-containing protein [Firmicutes bacterium]|nr:SIS domain-containing protein [Bacillota bacterium]
MDQQKGIWQFSANGDGKSPAYIDYFEQVAAIFNLIHKTQREAIEQAANMITTAMTNENSILHIFGTGHSHMLAEELFYRAGGFANVNAMLETGLMLHEGAAKSTALERLHGYAPKILDRYGVRSGEVLIIASNSGINPVPVEMARTAHERGLSTIAITSLKHSRSMESRDHMGQKLFDVADLTIDNCCEFGDASVSIDGLPYPIGPLSSLAGILILNGTMCQVAENLIAQGVIPPTYVSSNIGVGDEVASKWVEVFRGRIKHL